MRLIAGLALLGAIVCLWPPAAEAEDARLERSTAELEKVRERILGLARTLEQDKGQQDALRSSLQQAERRISEAVAGLRALDRDIRAQERKVEHTRRDRLAADKGLSDQKGALAAQVRAAYLIGQQERTKLLLNQEDPSALSRVLTYYDYVNRARTARILGIQEQIQLLRRLEARLQEEVQELATLRAQQEANLNHLEAGRAEREVAMERIQGRIRNQGKELEQLKFEEDQLAKLINALRDLLADIPADLGSGRPFGKSRGRLPWPARGKLLARFGAPKAGGRLNWNGMWISARSGDPVKAVAQGRVAYVGWMHRYGLIAVVEHDDGYYTLYGHNQAVFKSAGEWVQAGDTLASVGNTGGHEQDGVYFEIRKGADPVNPQPWLSR